MIELLIFIDIHCIFRFLLWYIFNKYYIDALQLIIICNARLIILCKARNIRIKIIIIIIIMNSLESEHGDRGRDPTVI